MQLIVADFETFYSDTYSLSKAEFTTESYIRDPQFRAHGCGFRMPDGVYIWITHDDLPAFLASIEWRSTALLCHHAQFDGLIFSHHYGVIPKLYLDTKSMGNLVLPNYSKKLDNLATYYGLPNKTVPYNLFRNVRELPPYIERQVAAGCLHDVELNFQIFTRMMSGANGLPPFPPGELPIVDQTIRLFTDPVLHIDVARAQALADQIALEKETVLDRLGLDKEVLASRECFAELLRELGVEPPMKPARGKTAQPGQLSYAFAKSDPGMIELLESEDDDIAALAAAKLGVSSTIGETRANRIAGIGARGATTIYLNYAGAHTGRPAAGDRSNFLNMPRDGRLRACLKAPPGYKIIVADKNAIECRLLNYLAKNENVVQAFRNHEDVYAQLAQEIYRYPVNKTDQPAERNNGKVIELASGYGLGAKMLQRKMSTGAIGGKAIPTTEEQAQLYIGTYRRTHKPVTDYWKAGDWALQVLYNKGTAEWGPMLLDKGYIFLANGSFLTYVSLHYRKDETTGKQELWVNRRNGASRIFGPKLVENVTQALAWTITTDDIKVLSSEMKIVLYPYDEIVAVVPEREADQALARMISVMSRTPAWAPGLPVEAEGAVMERYAKP